MGGMAPFGYTGWRFFFEMPESIHLVRRTRRAEEIFDEMRKRGMTNQQIFGEALVALKQLARKMTARDPAGASMCASRLLSDVYEKMFDSPASKYEWESGADFFRAVSKAMLNLKSDYRRKKKAKIRPPVDQWSEKHDEAVATSGAQFEEEWLAAEESEALDDALAKLKEEHPDYHQAMELKYWGNEDEGLTDAEVAEVLKVARETVTKRLQKGRAKIKHYLSS
jgi:RNA polymerase sigma factor (sigma-70 family)